METLILWIGFAGAWLLFAGSVYQAALELKDEDIELDRIRVAGAKVQKPSKISIWWWLLPPFKLYKEYKNRREYEHRYIKALTSEDIESMVSYRSKATAWLFVAVGGFCIACKETYELAEHKEWNNVALILIIFGMLLLSILNLITRIKRAEAITKL